MANGEQLSFDHRNHSSFHPVWTMGHGECVPHSLPGQTGQTLVTKGLDSVTIRKAVAQAFPDTVEQLEAFNCLGNWGVPQMRN